MTSSTWRCPNCGLPIYQSTSQWSCDNGHTFDIAKEGYVNLLLSNEKRSKEPGDNKEMMNARRAFLETGHYIPLVEKLCHIISNTFESASNTNKTQLLDVGCGEGFYLRNLKQRLGTKNLAYKGIDISKIAIQKAAKRKLIADLAVASSFKVPVIDSSIDLVLQIFAPSDDSEIKRVLTPNGIWLLVQPGPEHLFELKERVYESPSKHEEKVPDIDGFSVLRQERLRYKFVMNDKEQRFNLLKMTPFYWRLNSQQSEQRTTEQKKKSIMEELSSVTADFMITALKKEAL